MKLINIDEEIMGGQPVFNGTRVPVTILFDYLDTNETVEEFLDNFPSVTLTQAETMAKLYKEYGRVVLENQAMLNSLL